MVLKTKRRQLFLNVNKLEIGLLMNGFPLNTWLNCNNPIQMIKSDYSQGNDPYSQNQSISKRFFQQDTNGNLRPVDCCGIVPPKRSS
jgi:hypothetical protein